MNLTEEIAGVSGQIEGLFSGYEIDLQELLALLLQGKITEVMKLLFHDLARLFRGEAESFLKLMVLLLCISIIAAMLMNLTDLFENRQISDIGFYFVYLFLILILIKAFGTVTETAQALLSDMLVFMKLFMPVFFMAVGAASGVTTGLLYYQFILGLIYCVETALSVFLMPLIKVYIFLAFMNGLWMEEKLHMLLELLQRIIGYVLKLSLAAVTGISMLQSIITPVIDSLKMAGMQKTIALIPGIGGISDSVAELVVGSAILVKNSVGALAVLLFLLLCALPAVKIWLLAMMLKFAAAIAGIVSDRRIAACMDRVGEGSLLVLRVLLTACSLFLITIAIAVMTTNRGSDMEEYLMTLMKRASVFMILSQALIHFRPNPSYEKYLKFLAGIMTVVILIIPVMEWSRQGITEQYNDAVNAYMERLQEMSAQELAVDMTPSQSYLYQMGEEMKGQLNDYFIPEGYLVSRVEIMPQEAEQGIGQAGEAQQAESCFVRIWVTEADRETAAIAIDRIEISAGGDEALGSAGELQIQAAGVLGIETEQVEILADTGRKREK